VILLRRTFPCDTLKQRIHTGAGNSILTNAEVIAILMDITTYQQTGATITRHVEKPPAKPFLNAKMSGYNPTPADCAAGVGTDLVDRDPWAIPTSSRGFELRRMCQTRFIANSGFHAKRHHGWNVWSVPAIRRI